MLFTGYSVRSPESILAVFSCSGQSHAHVQRSRGHWHHGLRHSRPRTDVSKAAAERSLVRHPQPASAGKDGRRVQGLREYVRSYARHLSRNIRCVSLIQSPLVDLIIPMAAMRKGDNKMWYVGKYKDLTLNEHKVQVWAPYGVLFSMHSQCYAC